MIRRSFAALLGLVAAMACSDEHPAPLGLSGAPSAITTVSGQDQVGPALSTLPQPLRVRVTDAGGSPVPALEVRWTTQSGTVSAPVDSTDNNGFAETLWTLPASAGPVTADATVEGLGSASFNAMVQPITGITRFRYVDAGAYHSCGITETEEVLCWGLNVDGQLGRGTLSQTEQPGAITGGQRYRMTSGGRYHSCGITLSEMLYCWGLNAEGRLGQPGNGDPEPTPILLIIENADTGKSGTVRTWQSVSAGRNHSCGLTLGRELYCWGSNDEMQLGDVTTELGNIIVFVSDAARTVAAGGLHSCAVDEDQVLFCWGFNAEGQVGVGLGQRNVLPSAVGGSLRFLVDPDTVPREPTGVPFGPSIAAGYAHSCAIATTGVTYCWGINEHGQLGIGNRLLQYVPVPVGGGLPFVTVTAGYEHTCGLTAAGAAYCWGSNFYGQLGDGTQEDRLGPNPVAGGLVFQSINAGDTYTCGVTREGIAHCWGDNEYSQLGDLTVERRLVPTKVAFQP